MPISAAAPCPTHRPRWRRTLALLLAGALLTGCGSLGYYAQAIDGQFELWRRARPITEVLDDPQVPAATRMQLERIVAMRSFAARTLDLPAHGSYHDYADLGREFVVWNVVATPAFDLAPQASCFLFVGCLDYRGYFSRDAARRHADALETAGLDVFVGGVPAYSTLGWLDDPVLNTFVDWPDIDLARLLFHELAHQRVYVADDTRFNESYATAVGEAGLRAWLATRPGELATARAQLRHEREITALVLATRTELVRLYERDVPAADLRRAKARSFAQLREGYAALSAGWATPDHRYDAAFAAPWNNARIAALATYNDLVDDFLAVFAACDEDFARFHATVAALAAESRATRTARLAARPARCSGTTTGATAGM